MAANPFTDTTTMSDGSIGSTSRPLTPLPQDTRFGGAPELVQRHSSAMPPSMMFGTPRDSVGSVEGGPLAAEGAALAGVDAGAGAMTAKEMTEGAGGVGTGDASAVGAARRRRQRRWILLGLVVFFVVAAAVAVPVGVIFGRKDSSSGSGGSSGGSSGGGAAGGKNGATSGGDGSTVTAEDGSTFTYSNPFGGIWVDDPNDPFTGSAFPNSWTPPLNTSWTWGVDRLYGVNLGGWFVLEPFIAPALFEKYQNATAIAANNDLPLVVDEWTLSQAMAADTSAGGGLSQLEAHYNTFVIVSFLLKKVDSNHSVIQLHYRTGYRANCRRRSELAPGTDTLLGSRRLGYSLERGAFPCAYLLDIHSPSFPMGPQIWVTHQP